MTRSRTLAMVTMAMAAGVSSGCPNDPAPGPNPPILWLGLDGSETEVRLVTVEPAEY